MPQADLLARLPEDPGAPETPAEDLEPAPAKVVAPKVDTRAAVMSVLALMGRGNTDAGAKTATPGQQVLPSARARAAIERLVNYGTAEALEAAQPDLKALCRDLFDWRLPDGQTKASKSMAKAVGAILLARTEEGVSLYPQAVEMLSFASAAAPLLQMDRLLRLIENAPKVSSAFAPERYTMQLASVLNIVFSRYPEQRREQLLVSLWEQVHEGRWWDLTSGIVQLDATAQRRRKKKSEDEEAAEAAQAEEAHRAACQAVVRDLLAGANVGTEQANDAIITGMMSGTLPYHQVTEALVSQLPPNAGVRNTMADLAARMRAGELVDPDIALHASHLPWLLPSERPETPLTWLLRTLIQGITPDPETGVAEVDALPDKPREFKELFPAADLVGFPFPNYIHRLDRTQLEGAPGTLLELVHNAAELEENREHMRNCTAAYKSRMEAGTYALFKVWRGVDCYNGSVITAGGHWQLGEINSRFNAGNVPDDVRAAFNAMIAQLPAPVTRDGAPGEARTARRQAGYGVG